MEIAAKNRELLLGPDDFQVIALYQQLGKAANPMRAERWFRQAITRAERRLGVNDALVAVLIGDLAANLQEVGEASQVAELQHRMIGIAETSLNDPSCLADPTCQEAIAVMLVNIGAAKLEQRDLVNAERRLQQARALWADPAVPNRYFKKSELLLQLGLLYQRKGEVTQAEKFFRQLVALEEEGSHPLSLGQAWRQLGELLLAKGTYPEAAKAFQQAEVFLEKTGQPRALAQLWRARRRLYWVIGQLDLALAAQQRAVELTESELGRLLVSGSEWEKLKLLTLAREETNETLALHAKFGPHSANALRLAFTVWLQRKARVQDEMSRTVGVLRNNLKPELRPLLTDLLNKQSRLARLATTPREENDRAAQVAQLTQELEQLQRTLSARSQEYQVQVQPVTLAAVQSALPAKTALVDFARYQPFDELTRQPLPARYGAFLLLPDGAPRWVDLGPATVIERVIKTWRTAFTPQGKSGNKMAAPDVRRLTRQLDALVMQPVRARLGNIRQVFIASDGALNLAPFAALIDERGRELVRDYLFIYLTSGRDLLRLQVKQQSGDEILLVAAPDYDDGSEIVATTTPAAPDDRAGRLSRSATALGPFKPLPYARAEVEAVQRLFPTARVLFGKAASESALKRVQRPRFLHLSTHGVFLQDQETDQPLENPLLRSWVALAGANQRKSGPPGQEEDGILTAYEAAALDLWGTKLVVLSACETGLGEVKSGEGVYGLRRALVLAGAETQITTLWKVDDYVTKNLMESYYGKLQRGAGRLAALREVQLELLSKQATSHPRFWAGFICLGEWANLKRRARGGVYGRVTRNS